ncbi:hypothetical protein LENED_003656 [Lentinula edodes]|uniref:Uncharacterized protein n=1 Tax=Lentinula edodes TaxID=5353 RepID=A0A1Q3E450_LENED|nr:hypothetical protein LENED_003656 [Lentinula edodes]
MSQQHTSKPGTYFAANARSTIPCTNALKLTRSPPPPLRFARPTQYQHDLDSQQNDGCGKENHPSAYLKQVEPPRTQMLKTGPAVLQNSIVSNVHHEDPVPAIEAMVGHVPKHPTPQDFVSASSGDNACTPVAQRFTVPVLSYQSTLSNSRQGCSASISGAQNPKTSSIPSSTQPHVYRTVPLGGSIGYAARATHTQASADANLDPRNSTHIRSFRASESQLSTNVVRPNASGANGTLQDHDQSYLPTACPPPSPEVQCFVSPEAYIPLITGNTASSTIFYAPGMIPTKGTRVTSVVPRSPLWRPSSSTASDISGRLQYSSHTGARGDGHSNGTPAAVESVVQFSPDEGITDNTLTPKPPAYRYTLSTHPHHREGSITPTQASVSAQQESKEPFPHSISNGLPQGSLVYGPRRVWLSNDHSHNSCSPKELTSHASHSVAHIHPSNESERIGSRPRGSSLNEHAAPFIPGQGLLSTPLPPPCLKENVLDLNSGFEAPDEDFDNDLEHFLDAVLNLENIAQESILPEPIAHEDITTYYRGLANSYFRGFESKHCYYLLNLLIEGLTDHEIRERFGADLFSASGLVVQRLLKLNIPPGITGSNLLLFLQIGRVQSIIIGILFKSGLVPAMKLMEFLWSLLEDSPHQARITIIFELITAAGKDICGSSNARQIGDFLTALHRKYVVPPQGRLFPDVFLAPKEHKEPIFNYVRSLLQKIRMLTSQWRLLTELRP